MTDRDVDFFRNPFDNTSFDVFSGGGGDEEGDDKEEGVGSEADED